MHRVMRHVTRAIPSTYPNYARRVSRQDNGATTLVRECQIKENETEERLKYCKQNRCKIFRCSPKTPDKNPFGREGGGDKCVVRLGVFVWNVTPCNLTSGKLVAVF
jgi:hypothetical protein